MGLLGGEQIRRQTLGFGRAQQHRVTAVRAGRDALRLAPERRAAGLLGVERESYAGCAGPGLPAASLAVPLNLTSRGRAEPAGVVWAWAPTQSAIATAIAKMNDLGILLLRACNRDYNSGRIHHHNVVARAKIRPITRPANRQRAVRSWSGFNPPKPLIWKDLAGMVPPFSAQEEFRAPSSRSRPRTGTLWPNRRGAILCLALNGTEC